MNRRDTIIVGALVNAGVLMVMFVSALQNRPHEEKMTAMQSSSDLIVEEKIAFHEPKKIIGDEVEAVLKQYVQQDPLQVPAQEEVYAIPVAAAFPAQEEAPGYTEVKVQKGDMLEKLARQHHSSVSLIMKANNLTSSQLKIGQVLKIPSSSTAAAPVAKTEAAPADPSAKFYTVKPGDSPWTIAVKNHLKVEDLLKLNNMSEEKAKKLRPGDQIRIR